MKKSLDEIKKLWEEETDEWLVRAVTENLKEYKPEVQEIIRNEVQRRGLEGVEYCKPSIVKEVKDFVFKDSFNPQRDGYAPRFSFLSKAIVPVIICFEGWGGVFDVLIAELMKKLFYKQKKSKKDIIYKKK